MLAMAKSSARFRKARLGSALAILNDRERQIFVARHLTDNEDTPTLETLSNNYGVSRERVRQLEARAYQKVSAHLKQHALQA